MAKKDHKAKALSKALKRSGLGKKYWTKVNGVKRFENAEDYQKAQRDFTSEWNKNQH